MSGGLGSFGMPILSAARIRALEAGADARLDFDIYLSSTGSDSNSGRSPAQAVRTYARAEEIFPEVRTGALRLHFLDAGPFDIASGLHYLPPPASADTPPVQFIGVFDQDAGGHGGGVRTVAAVGTDSVQDVAGGLTVNYYGAFIMRRTGGAGVWGRYFVTQNDVNHFVVAFPWVNGGAPIVGDTFVIEFAASEIRFDDVIFDLNGNTLICDGMNWNGAANPVKHWVWQGGTVYPQGARIDSQNGRTLVRCSMRTVDTLEQAPLPSPFPAEMPDTLGVGIFSGDLTIEAGGDFSGAISSGGVNPTFDFLNDAGGTVIAFDSFLGISSQNNSEAASRSFFFKSTAGARQSFSSALGSAIAPARGGVMIVTGADYSNAPGEAVRVLKGGILYTSGLTGVGNAAFGIEVDDGGQLIDDGTSTITGALGDLLIAGTVYTWSQFRSLGGSTQRSIVRPPLNDFTAPRRGVRFPGPVELATALAGGPKFSAAAGTLAILVRAHAIGVRDSVVANTVIGVGGAGWRVYFEGLLDNKFHLQMPGGADIATPSAVGAGLVGALLLVVVGFDAGNMKASLNGEPFATTPIAGGVFPTPACSFGFGSTVSALAGYDSGNLEIVEAVAWETLAMTNGQVATLANFVASEGTLDGFILGGGAPGNPTFGIELAQAMLAPTIFDFIGGQQLDLTGPVNGSALDPADKIATQVVDQIFAPPAEAAPAAPAAGFRWFIDAADGKLKVKGSGGTVTTIALP